MTTTKIESVLTFWFGELSEHGADQTHQRNWFTKDEAFDASIRASFLEEHQAITRGEREAWLSTPRGRLAYVIVLDQFSRNMFRGTPETFASDAKALAVAKAGIDAGEDRSLAVDERVFLYMPLMHSEALADQDRCVDLFSALSAEHPNETRIARNVTFAKAHRDIVARFGRFPHRNEILGRSSTSEEQAFLKEPNSSF